jgi:hypothetical protein
MHLPLADAHFVYLELRRNGRLVEQLRIWVAYAGGAQETAWRDFLAWIPALEARVAEANRSLAAGDQVPGSGDSVEFLVSAARKIVGGGDLSHDEELLAWLPRLFLVEDDRREWLTVAGHTLRGTAVIGKVVVPVAFVLKAPREGFLARLEVEVLAEGAEVIANHPAQTLESNQAFRDDFLDSLRAAFLAASAATGQKAAGRWRLLPWEKGGPLPKSFDGPSLGAAAARAWALALRQLKADPRVLVIAQIQSSGEVEALTDNQGVVLKALKACTMTASANAFGPDAIDTIVVVGEANQVAAEQGIAAAGAAERVRVVRLDLSRAEASGEKAA